MNKILIALFFLRPQHFENCSQSLVGYRHRCRAGKVYTRRKHTITATSRYGICSLLCTTMLTAGS